MRQKVKKDGGVFKNWSTVVIIDDQKCQETYRMILELGGAKVARWTVKHLSDLNTNQMESITHVISHPNMLLNEDFQEFLRKNDETANIPVLAYIYVGDYLVKPSIPSISLYNIRTIAMIDLLASEEHKDLLRKTITGTIQSIPVPLFVPDADDDLQFTQPDHNDVADTRDRVDDEDDFIQIQSLSTPITHTRKRSASKELFAEVGKKLKCSEKRVKEMEIVALEDDETVKRNNNISQLKSLAQTFIKKGNSFSKSPSRAGSTQCRIDSWVSKSPRKLPTDNKPLDEDISILGGSPNINNSGSSRFNRRQVSSQKPDEEISFLSQTRSGSIKRSQSARSHSFFSQSQSSSQDSNTQDSLLSEADSDSSQLLQSFDISKIDKDPDKQKLWLITLMTAQRRLESHRLDIGPGSLPLEFPKSSMDPSQLSPYMCRNIWNCLESEEDQLDLEREIDLGWINACDYMVQSINEDIHLPSAAMHKIMMDAIRNHKDRVVRITAFNSLLHCVNFHPPGPGNQGVSKLFRDSYLEMFSRETPYVGKWEFNPNDPWEFLETTIEKCIKYSQNNNNYSDSSGDISEEIDDKKALHNSNGFSLLLKLFTIICESDMNNWFNYITEQDTIDFTAYKPFLACVLCPKDNVGWSKQHQSLIKLYVKAISLNSQETDLVNVRKLIGLAAQILQYKDRVDNSHNRLKLELSTCLAFQLTSINLSEQRLWCELYLMEPSWMSSLVSRFMLGISTNTDIKEAVSLRSTITRFVDIDLSTAVEEDPDIKSDTSIVTSTPMSKKTMNNNVPVSSMSPVSVKFPNKSSHEQISSKKSKSSKKTKSANINVNKKNQYGETPLHLAAKKGNVLRMEDCLNTPGVDINCACNNGYTPLAEAVHRNHPEIVTMLLNFTPKSLPINNYFTPTKSNVPQQRRMIRVDILKQNNDNLQNPFHEAVENGNVEIAKLILESLAHEETKPDSELPSVANLLTSNTGKGETTISLAKSEDMKTLLKKYSNNIVKNENKENSVAVLAKPGAPSFFIKDPLAYKVLVEMNIVKYISSNSLSHVYRLFKGSQLADLLNAMNDTSDSFKTVEKWGRIQFRGGFKPTLFGKKKARFEIHRDKTIMAQDLRDYEKLRHFEKALMNVGECHLLTDFLRNLKITKM